MNTVQRKRLGIAQHGRASRYPVLAVLLLLLMPSACGWQLRGTQSTQLPSALIPLQIEVGNAPAAYDALRLAMEQLLRQHSNATVVSGRDDVARLVFAGESMKQSVMTVSPLDAKVSQYLLTYRLRYRLVAANGETLLPWQQIVVQQDYRFDTDTVLATEREQAGLRTALRQQALQQVLRRLSRLELGV